MTRNQHPEGLETVPDVTEQHRLESIQRCNQSLEHCSQCRDANCRRMSCYKMKRVVQHSKRCENRVDGTCPLCKQLIGLSCYHAKQCDRDGCMVPFCKNIRQKMAEGQKMNMMENLEVEDKEAPGGSTTSNAPNSLLDGDHGAKNKTTYGAAPCAKEWQTTVTGDLRNRLVEKLVKSIFPEPTDLLLQELICYEKKVEEEIFKVADSLDQYFDLITEEFYQIQKEMQDKKNTRLAAGTASQDQDEFTNNIPSTAEMMGVKNSEAPGANEQNDAGEGPSMEPYQDQPVQIGDDPFVQEGYCPLGVQQHQQQQSMQMAEEEMENLDIGDDWELIENE